jgi:hypothetical protein
MNGAVADRAGDDNEAWKRRRPIGLVEDELMHRIKAAAGARPMIGAELAGISI